MKKSGEKASKGDKQRQHPPQRRQQQQQSQPQEAQSPHPHPRTFESGGCCNFNRHGDHFHAEGVEDNGLIDVTLPHVYTREEQNVLVWLVFRNRHKFKKIKPNEPLMLMVPNIDPSLSGYQELERNLGTDTAGLMLKVYRLLPPDEQAMAFITACGLINAAPKLEEQIAIINQLTEGEPDHLLSRLPAALKDFCEQPGVTRGYLYFFTDQHLRFLEQAYDEIFELFKRKEKGVANYTRCTHFHHDGFPVIVKVAPTEINDRVINFFDRISKALPEKSIVFYLPHKQSPGGWRIWETNQPGVYTALLCATATDTIIGSKLIEAIAMAFNDNGLKARNSFHSGIEKPAVEIAFSCEKLESMSLLKLELELGAIITKYSTPLAAALAK
jgi:hypothetical protein